MIYRTWTLVAIGWFAGGVLAYAQDTVRLEPFLVLVEQNHPSLRAASYEPDLAEAEIRGALGRFDPDLSLEYVYKDKSGDDKVNFLDGSIQLPLDMLFGPKIKAGYRRGIGFQIDPERATAGPGEASLGIALPLFQGIFTDSRRTRLQKALQRPEAAQAQYQIERNALLRAAGNAYWYWVEAEAKLSVADSILDLASARMRQISATVRAGERPAIDSVEIAQEVMRRRGNRLEALRSAEQARIRAGVYLWSGGSNPEPLTGSAAKLPSIAIDAIDRQVELNRASLLRPELTRITVLQRLARLDSALSREYLRPFVELEAAILSYDVSSVTNTDYKLGLTVSQPLLFRSASAGAQVADIAVQRTDLSLLLVQRVVEADVLNAIVAVQRATDRMDVAQTEVAISEQMVAAERRLQVAGESSLLQINLRERFLAEALSRLVSARADYARALVDLRWATGRI
jgi:outer membrane protein TolC